MIDKIFIASVNFGYSLSAHRKECGKGAQCPLCPKIVTQKRNLAKHMERHAKDGLLDHYLQSALDVTNCE